MYRESMAWREIFLGYEYILSGNGMELSRLRRLPKGPFTRFLLAAFLSMSPDFIAPLCAAEIWYFPMQGRDTRACILRSEDSIDEVWDKLERETSTSWSIPIDMSMLPGIVLQSTQLNKEYTLYRSREACEYERATMEIFTSGDPKMIKEYKRTQTKEKTLAALAPKNVEKKQEWLNGFAGCTDAALRAGNVTKGKVDDTISFCSCVAMDLAQMSSNMTEAELDAKNPLIVQKCLPKRWKSNP
jgi:hypothetical protein